MKMFDELPLADTSQDRIIYGLPYIGHTMTHTGVRGKRCGLRLSKRARMITHSENSQARSQILGFAQRVLM